MFFTDNLLLKTSFLKQCFKRFLEMQLENSKKPLKQKVTQLATFAKQKPFIL